MKKEGEDPSSLKLLKDRAQTFCEPFKSANLWVPDDTVLAVNRLSYWVPIPWDNRNGRITLAGDAAHPMTFRESPFFLSCSFLSRAESRLDVNAELNEQNAAKA
jgi:hypothetical protein